VDVWFQNNYREKYESLVGLWNKWYGEYSDAAAADNSSFPRLIVRFEDLLFHHDEVMTQVCECAGGTVTKDIENFVGVSAKGEFGPHTGGSGLLSSIQRYGHAEKRVERMTKEDLVYARGRLRGDMMEAFGYSYPE